MDEFIGTYYVSGTLLGPGDSQMKGYRLHPQACSLTNYNTFVHCRPRVSPGLGEILGLMDSFIDTLLFSLPPPISLLLISQHWMQTFLVKIRFSQGCLRKSDMQFFNKYSFTPHCGLGAGSDPGERLLTRQTQLLPLMVLTVSWGRELHINWTFTK